MHCCYSSPKPRFPALFLQRRSGGRMSWNPYLEFDIFTTGYTIAGRNTSQKNTSEKLAHSSNIQHSITDTTKPKQSITSHINRYILLINNLRKLEKRHNLFFFAVVVSVISSLWHRFDHRFYHTEIRPNSSKPSTGLQHPSSTTAQTGYAIGFWKRSANRYNTSNFPLVLKWQLTPAVKPKSVESRRIFQYFFFYTEQTYNTNF